MKLMSCGILDTYKFSIPATFLSNKVIEKDLGYLV